MRTRTALFVFTVLAAAMVPACGSDSPSPSTPAAGTGGSWDAGNQPGTEGGPCYGNGTCNDGLVCLSNLCVNPGTGASGGSAGDSGGGGTGASAGTAGAAGAAGTAGAPTRANYPLQIIQPEPNLTTKNRFYKAYPGFEYNVRMGVIGGVYPFIYELVTAPTGMSINSITGEITWPSPTESATPYDVTARVIDDESSIQEVSWTVLVTTAGFNFVDAVNGTTIEMGGTGTIANPWKTLGDVYGGATAGRTDVHKRGEFVYFRAGDYLTADVELQDEGLTESRTAWRADNKPLVWLAYPGDTSPRIDMGAGYIYFDYYSRDVYFDGVHFDANANARSMGVKMASEKENVVFRRCKFSGITGGYQGGNNAMLFLAMWGTGRNYVVQDNDFRDVTPKGYGILNYRTEDFLVEDNLYTNISDHPVGMKVQSRRWDVRSNRFRNNPNQCVELHYNKSDWEVSGHIEVRHNVVESGGGDLNVNQSYQASGDAVYIYRNTIVDGAIQRRVTSTNGPFHWYHNVIINTQSGLDKIEKFDISDPNNLIIYDNLVGEPVDNIVDSNGDLTSGYSEFIGTRGHQVVRN